jgi:hypothetical protein
MYGRFAILNVQFPFLAVPEAAAKRYVRPQGVHMHVKPAARTKNPHHFAHYLFRLIAMMENPVRINIVEASIIKRELASVSLVNDGALTNPVSGQLHMV